MNERTRVGVVCAVVGALWSGGAAAQPFVYVANLRGDEVAVIDSPTLQPLSPLPFADDPDGIAVSPDGRRVYVSGFVSNTVGVIDADTNQLLGTVAVGPGPVGLAVTPDGERIYVTQRGADNVAAIGVASGTVEATIPVGRGPNGIAITPDGRTAFVTNSFTAPAGEVSVLDLASDTVRNTIVVARKPNRVAITPDGRSAYVTNFRSWTSTAIDVASESVRTTFRAGLKSTSVAVNPNGFWAYVTDARSGDLMVVDISADQVTRAIPVGSSLTAIGLLRNGGTGYVGDAADALHVVDLGEEEVVADVAVSAGSLPYAVAANCVDDGCSETPYTPKPTRTATDTPTVTATPTATLTTTATATASPTRTLGPGQSPVAFTLRVLPISAGAWTTLIMDLDTGGQPVSGIREQVTLPDGVSFDEAFGDCAPIEDVAASHAEFHMITTACGTGSYCNALTAAIDFDPPLTGTRAVYSCLLFVDESAPIGTLRLHHLENTALDAEGGALPSRGRDGILVIAPPATPSPELTPKATRTPTEPPVPEISLGGDPISARPGERTTLTVRLTTNGRSVVATENDIEFPDGIAVAARGGGNPDCRVNPDIDKNASAFAFQPAGCVPGVSCTGLRGLVLSFDEQTAIPNGAALYTCALVIASDVSPGSYQLDVFNAGGSTARGERIFADGVPIAVTVQGAGLRRTAANGTRVCAGGGADGNACATDDDCPLGVCVRPQGVCDGGVDDGLLCDCAGGRCDAAGSSCGRGADAGVCDGGTADGACCDRSFNCAGGAACTATQRICVGGPTKGSPCLTDAHCLGGACLATTRRCAGGDFDGIACVDSSDCPAAACVEARAPTPTRLPEQSPPSPSHASSSAGCAIAPAGNASAWWLLPALLLLAVRGMRFKRPWRK